MRVLLISCLLLTLPGLVVCAGKAVPARHLDSQLKQTNNPPKAKEASVDPRPLLEAVSHVFGYTPKIVPEPEDAVESQKTPDNLP